MSRDSPRLLLLTADGSSSRIVYHALARAFGAPAVVMEPRISRVTLTRRRLKRLPPTTVAGQVLFSALAVPALHRAGRHRIEEIVRDEHLDTAPIPSAAVTAVPSVNTPEARQALQDVRPDLVVVNGTRIIGVQTLSCIDAPFVNTHAGITPQYRGVHGGYWALVEGRPELVGTTVHLVDKGVDTGPILGQATFTPTSRDNFATYSYLHTAAGVRVLLDVVGRYLNGGGLPSQPPLSKVERSQLRYHPTIWGYLRAGVR